nr:MAG TPA: Putative tail fiber protein fold, Tail fiber, receptor [Caudoviricetes sp.]
MSILKSIMHNWNKTTKSYDTLHPETESAQITDWHSGIMASLASTTLGTVVSAVTTDSVLGKLIKLLLDASGVKYLINTNGYVCFGSLFGGLIIQWGMPLIDDTAYYVDYQLPISMPHEVLMVVCSDLVGEAATTATIWKTCWNVKASTTTAVRFIAESRNASSIAAVIIGY